jgi:hypothetical protein
MDRAWLCFGFDDQHDAESVLMQESMIFFRNLFANFVLLRGQFCQQLQGHAHCEMSW